MLQRCQGRAVQPAAFSLSPAYKPSLTPHPLNHCHRAAPKSDVPLCPLHYKSDCFTSICSASLCFLPQMYQRWKLSHLLTASVHAQIGWRNRMPKPLNVNPLDKSGRINMHNRRALFRRARGSQSTVFPITEESISLTLVTKQGSKICYRRMDLHSHQDLVHLKPGPLMIPPFQLLNLGVASSSFQYEWKLFPESLYYLTLKRMQTWKSKYHFLF